MVHLIPLAKSREILVINPHLLRAVTRDPFVTLCLRMAYYPTKTVTTLPGKVGMDQERQCKSLL